MGNTGFCQSTVVSMLFKHELSNKVLEGSLNKMPLMSDLLHIFRGDNYLVIYRSVTSFVFFRRVTKLA